MNFISQFFYELTSIIMALLMGMGMIVTPGTADVITAIEDDAEIRFILTGDPQVSNYMPERETNVISAAQDIMNSDVELDAFIIAGDIVENGFQDEFDRVYDDINPIPVKNFIMCAGNHDIRLREYEQSKTRLLTFMNNLNKGNNPQEELHFKYMVGDYTFLVMGSDESRFEDAYISDAQLEWLNIELKEATKDGKPVFVICHYPLAESHGLPNTWGSSDSTPTEDLPTYELRTDFDFTGSIGDQNAEVYGILSKYENVFFLTGHLHTGLGRYTYQTLNEENNVQGINVPSLGINNKDGMYNNPGTGLYVEVTPDEVIFYARDFVEGRFLTEDDFHHAVMTYELQK